MDFVDNNIQKVQVQSEDQVYARNEDIKVYGKLVSMSTENVVADSEQIWDEALKKNQSEINSQTQSKFGEYLPLTGGDINGNLNVDGTVGLQGTLTLGDSLHIEEGNFAFEGADNESLTINYNGLTYAFTETDSQGFKVKEGDAQLNNITVIPKQHNDTDRRVSHISPGMITVDDGSNSANFTPTSIELSMSSDSGDTHVTAKTINTNEVLLTQSKAHGTQTVDTSITPGLIRLHQTPGGATHITTIQPTGIRSSMFQLTDGTDQDVLLGDGSTTDRLIKDVTAGAIQGEYNFNFTTTGNVNKFVTIKAATSTTAGVMTAADKTKLDNIENTYLPLSGGTVTGTLGIDFDKGIQIIEHDSSPRNTYIGNGSIRIESLDGDTSSVTSKTEIYSNSITTDGTVTAKGFVSKTEKDTHEVWACNGGSINLKTIIAATAVYVHGSIVESIAESINSTVTIEDPDAIIFNKATGSFVAKKGNGYYKYWNTIDNLLISDSNKYGFLNAKRGIVPYHKQLYMFANDNVNIYIANNTGSVPIIEVYID